MTCDPLSEIADAPLSMSDGTIRALTDFRAADKFLELPGDDTTVERQRLTSIFNGALDSIIPGLKSSPQKLWFMARLQPALEEAACQDTEAREHKSKL